MDRDALRALQAPLEERYAEQPEAARVTLAATGTLDDEIACNVQTGRALARAGLHPATGGDRRLLCSGDMLLEAPVGFASIALRCELDAPGADEEQLAALLKLTERCCVVLQTLRTAPTTMAQIAST